MRSTAHALLLMTAALTLCSFLAAWSSAYAEMVLRVAMTAGDIPDWTGAPDQGYEGYRFVGFSLYDSMVEWDLSRSDKAADIRPGLAESWEVDTKDPERWIFHLRKGVKFHDGCDWNGDSAVWNYKRVMDSRAPQYNTRHHAGQGWTLLNVATFEKVDDYTVALTTSIVGSLLPYEIAVYYQISNCAVTKLNNDYAAYTKAPVGSGPYKFDKLVPHERLEFVKDPGRPTGPQAQPYGSAADAGGHHPDRRAAVRTGRFRRSALTRRHPKAEGGRDEDHSGAVSA